MKRSQTKATPQSKARKPRAEQSSTAKVAELQAQAAIEEARHKQLCQLLEYTVHRHSEDYLRQLATTAVQVKALADVATMQAQLLQQTTTPPKPRKAQEPTDSNQQLHAQLRRAFKQNLVNK